MVMNTRNEERQKIHASLYIELKKIVNNFIVSIEHPNWQHSEGCKGRKNSSHLAVHDFLIHSTCSFVFVQLSTNSLFPLILIHLMEMQENLPFRSLKCFWMKNIYIGRCFITSHILMYIFFAAADASHLQLCHLSYFFFFIFILLTWKKYMRRNKKCKI